MAKWKQATNLVTTRFSRRVDDAPLKHGPSTVDARAAVELAGIKPRAVDAQASQAKGSSAGRSPRAKRPFAIPLDVGDRPPGDAAPRAVLERIKRAVPRPPKREPRPKSGRPPGRPRKNPDELATDARERVPGSILHAEMARLRLAAASAGMTPSALVQEIVRLYLSSLESLTAE